MGDARAIDQAKSQLGNIIRIMDEIKLCDDDNEHGSECSTGELNDMLDDAVLSIEPPSSVYRLLLCTGGPSVRLCVDTERGAVIRVWLEYQTWGTPWTRYPASAEELDYLTEFATRFEPYGGSDD